MAAADALFAVTWSTVELVLGLISDEDWQAGVIQLQSKCVEAELSRLTLAKLAYAMNDAAWMAKAHYDGGEQGDLAKTVGRSDTALVRTPCARACTHYTQALMHV